MKKILITGSTGQLGNSLGKVFKSRYDLVSTSRTKPNKSTNYFIGTGNFIAITKYNVSHFYAKAVYDLAQEFL